MIELKVRLFGAMRRYGTEAKIEVSEPVSPLVLRKKLGEKFGWDQTLLSESAIANESAILAETALIDRSCTVAVLPPVCGG